MELIDLERIRNALKDRNIMAVARACGVHHNALYRFMKKETTPRYEVLAKIVKYLKSKKSEV